MKLNYISYISNALLIVALIFSIRSCTSNKIKLENAANTVKYIEKPYTIIQTQTKIVPQIIYKDNIRVLARVDTFQYNIPVISIVHDTVRSLDTIKSITNNFNVSNEFMDLKGSVDIDSSKIKVSDIKIYSQTTILLNKVKGLWNEETTVDINYSNPYMINKPSNTVSYKEPSKFKKILSHGGSFLSGIAVGAFLSNNIKN